MICCVKLEWNSEVSFPHNESSQCHHKQLVIYLAKWHLHQFCFPFAYFVGWRTLSSSRLRHFAFGRFFVFFQKNSPPAHSDIFTIIRHLEVWLLCRNQVVPSLHGANCAEIHAARADKLDQSEKRIVEKTGCWLAESLNEPISESHGVKHGLWNKQTLSISNLHFDKTGRWKCLLDRL